MLTVSFSCDYGGSQTYGGWANGIPRNLSTVEPCLLPSTVAESSCTTGPESWTRIALVHNE